MSAHISVAELPRLILSLYGPLQVRVVDRQEGKLLPSGGTHHTLAYCVLPLTDVAQLISAGSSAFATVKLQLEHNGLPAGMLTLTLRFKMPQPVGRGDVNPTTRPGGGGGSMAAVGRLVRSSMHFRGSSSPRNSLDLKRPDPTDSPSSKAAAAMATMGRLVRASMGAARATSDRSAGDADGDGGQQRRRSGERSSGSFSAKGSVAAVGRMVRVSLGKISGKTSSGGQVGMATVAEEGGGGSSSKEQHSALATAFSQLSTSRSFGRAASGGTARAGAPPPQKERTSLPVADGLERPPVQQQQQRGQSRFSKVGRGSLRQQREEQGQP